jgi:hydrogenase maturation factor HypF (carbamoyltransferase family)
VFRLRLIREFKHDQLDRQFATLTLKGNARLEGGISRVEEHETEIQWEEALNALAQPSILLEKHADNAVVQQVQTRFPQVHTLGVMGHFKNTRHLYHWEAHELALDHTRVSKSTF